MKRIDFNQDWYYQEAEESEKVKVTLPHDAMLHGKRDANSPGNHANAFFTGGIYTYEKTVYAPEEWRDKVVFIEFGGVYQNSKVYINGREAGGRPYGYVPFTVSTEGFLEYGKDNKIKVIADNSNLPNSRWYSGGGIYRPVSLVIGNQDYIKWQGVEITTLDIEPARIQVKTSIAKARADQTSVDQTIADQTIAAEGTIRVQIIDGGQVLAEGSSADIILEIPNARLWSEDTPKLYQCKVILEKDGIILDEVIESFGIRKLSWNNQGFFVNGKQTLLRGACIHHDNGILGACTYRKAEERRIRILKENGYNAIRMSHHPAGRELLEACDKYGMYVMDETFDMWYYHKNKYDYALSFEKWHMEDIYAMVKQDFNHPSVILYSIGNEVSEPYKPQGVEMAKKMVDYLHALDTNRAVTAGINLMIINMASKGKGIYKEEGGLAGEEKKAKKKQKENASGSLFFNMMVSMIGTGMNKQANSDAADQITSPVLDCLDIAGYNYASGRYPLDGKKHPDRIIVGTETFPQDIAKNWKMVKEYPYLIGDFMWTGWDYMGEAALGAWNYDGVTMQNVPYPWLLAEAGAIDIIGTAGAQAAYAAIVWGIRKQPYIGVRPINHPGKRVSKAVWRGTNAMPSWSWKNCEGNMAEVEVYADASYVQLELNGKKLKKKKIKDYKAIFKVKYEAGTLKVIAYDEAGQEIGKNELHTAKGTRSLSIVPEENERKPGEIVYVDIAVTGENKIVESNEDDTLNLIVENGELLGFGSANPCTEEKFYSGTYTTYYGRALAVVRLGEKGKTLIKVTSAQIGTQQTEINIQT